jgi:hypothetical protein
MAALTTLPFHNPAIPDDVPDDALVLVLEDAVTLDSDGAASLADAATALAADAWFGDIEIAGHHQRRSAWSPTGLLADPTTALPAAVRAGWLREYDVQPYDPALALHLAAHGALVGHLPQILTRHNSPLRQPRLEQVVAHVDTIGMPAVVTSTEGGFAITPRGGFAPEVTIIVPTAGATYPDGQPAVERLLASLDPLPDSVRILLVVGDEFRGDADALSLSPSASVTRRPPGPFNFSAAINHGLLTADTELVLLLNDDMYACGAGFIAAMALHLADPTVGGVGALLTYPDGTVQHAGVIIDDARPLHPFVGWAPSDAAQHGALTARDVAAVTGGCLMARRADLLAVGGLSTSFPLSLNDIDLCVRLRRTGHRVVIEPAARVVHHETLSRKAAITAEEWDRWIDRWGEIVDPWYHPDFYRPDDPHDLARNANHFPPKGAIIAPGPPRLPLLQSRVHRGRPAMASSE